MQKRIIGNMGEKIAAEFLCAKKFIIIESNFRTRGGEIDLVARDPGGELVFVEVKTRTVDSFGAGEDDMRYLKMKALRRTARDYVEKADTYEPYRIDFISVELDSNFKIKNIEHIEDVGGSGGSRF